MIAPLKVSAADLTKDQLAQVASMSKAYFAAVATADPDNVTPLTTPNFTVVGINGKDEGGRSRDDEPPGDDLTVRMPRRK